MSKKEIPKRVMKILWGRSGSKCTICRVNLIEEGTDGNIYPIGEVAHIEGENIGSARYNSYIIENDRSKYENLILLCPSCHTKVDNDIKEYTIERLKQIKKAHEDWIEESLKNQVIDITFAELDVIIKYLKVTPILENENYITIISPREKIKKNNLSPEVENLIIRGMAQVKQVREYLNRNPDILFSERLRSGFVNKYQEEKNNSLDGDALFYTLLDFASNNSNDFKIKAAGLSVLVYFFELCEVFEK